jgi:hypothetical protein
MSTKNITPQVQTLLTHLIKHGSISQAEAGLIYKIRALPRRISDLKETLASDEKYAGYAITRELKKDATGQRYARYTMVKVETPVLALADKSEEKPSGGLVTSNKFPEVGDRVVVVNAGDGGFYPNGVIGTVIGFYFNGKLDSKGRALMEVTLDNNRAWAIITDEVEVIVNA